MTDERARALEALDKLRQLAYLCQQNSDTATYQLAEEYRETISAALSVEAPEAENVCYETYILMGELMDHVEISNMDKWLDNLSEARLVHKDLLPVSVITPAKLEAPGDIIPGTGHPRTRTAIRRSVDEDGTKVVIVAEHIWDGLMKEDDAPGDVEYIETKGGEYKCNQCGRKNWVATTMITKPAAPQAIAGDVREAVERVKEFLRQRAIGSRCKDHVIYSVHSDVNREMASLTVSDLETLIRAASQAATRPVPQDDEIEKIMNMTDEQIKAVLLLEGRCPNCAANETKATILQTLYDNAESRILPEEPTGPMLMAGIHVLERSEDVEKVGTGPLAKMVYQHMVMAYKAATAKRGGGE